MHGGHGPATFPVPGSLAELHRVLEARLEDLADLGADPLRIELILARLDEIRPTAEGRVSRSEGSQSHRDRLTTSLTESLTYALTGQRIRLTGGPFADPACA